MVHPHLSKAILIIYVMSQLPFDIFGTRLTTAAAATAIIFPFSSIPSENIMDCMDSKSHNKNNSN